MSRQTEQEFESRLADGHITENQVREWLINQDWGAYHFGEKLEGRGGAKVYFKGGSTPAGDTLAWKSKYIKWIEIKGKDCFAWNNGKFTIGIDRVYYEGYKILRKKSPYEVLVLFLMRDKFPKTRKQPYPAPTGLYIQSMGHLMENEHSQTDKIGVGGTTFWEVGKLHKIAELSEIK